MFSIAGSTRHLLAIIPQQRHGMMIAELRALDSAVQDICSLLEVVENAVARELADIQPPLEKPATNTQNTLPKKPSPKPRVR